MNLHRDRIAMTDHPPVRRIAPHSLLRIALLAGIALVCATNVSVADPFSRSDGFDDERQARDDDDRRFNLEHDSLVISSSTYDRTGGALALLAVGTTLPNSAIATTKAVASNNYVTVWNNASVDGSFGATSPIQLTDVDPFSGHVFGRLAVPTDEVVTSFSSKSELGPISPRTGAGLTLCLSLMPGPGSARSTCRTPMRSQDRIRRTR
jgi:hypothetical protein